MIQSASVNGIEISYEIIGEGSKTLVLIAGGGNQMLEWSSDFCQLFVDQDFRVIRFDNRDVGTSTKLEDYDANPYSLDDMADDVADLIRHVTDEPVHVLGGSMGGMIAQRVAVRHRSIVATLCLYISTAGNAGLFKPSASIDALMTPISDDIEEYIEKRVELDRLLAGSKFEFDEAGKRLTRNEALDRCDDRAGQARHGRAFMLGIEESAYNIHVQNLRHLDLPTMVIQAGEDELFDPDHGEELAGLIPGAKYKVFDGLGHELPNGIWPSLVGAVVELTTERMV